MNDKNEFDILENTDQSVIDRLSAEFPPNDAEEKEKVFRMSERKFNIANTTSEEFTETDEQTVSGVEVYKRPVWKKWLSAAAAAVILIGGTAGGIKAAKHFRSKVRTVSEEEKQTAPFGDFSKADYQICDYSAQPVLRLSLTEIENMFDSGDDSGDAYANEDSDAGQSYMDIYGGIEISADKRDKIAEFMNNYDYSGKSLKLYFDSEADTYMISENGEEKNWKEYVRSMAETTPDPETAFEASDAEIRFESMADTNDFPMESLVGSDIAPYFQCIDGNVIRSIAIYVHGNEGGLAYHQFSYEEKDNELVVSPESYIAEIYEIDYDLFKSTITDILYNEEPTSEEATTEAPITDDAATDPELRDRFKFIEYDDYYKTAPFGDFAELEYQVCNDDSESSPRTIDEESVEHAHRLGISNITNPTYLPPCDEISPEHREKLAELFNSWDFDKTPKKSYVYDPETDMIALTEDGKTIQLDSMDSEDNSTKKHCKIFQSNIDNTYLSPINPYMIYETADEIRFISFYKFDNEGYLNYCSIKFDDINGTKYLFNDTIIMNSYAIDYDYFVDTMEAIFADEEYTIKKGTMAYKDDTYNSGKLNPLSGFADKEYWIYNSYKGNIDELPYVFISTESGLSYNASPRPALDPEKRRELEDFFGSQTWTERSADDKDRKSAVNNDESVTFDMLTDTEFSRIMLNLGSNTISVDTMPVEKLDGGDENYMQYRCTDQASHSMNLYSTDYPDMREKLQEILGDDFGTNKTFVKNDQ